MAFLTRSRLIQTRFVRCLVPQKFFHHQRYKLSNDHHHHNIIISKDSTGTVGDHFDIKDHVQYNSEGGVDLVCPKQAFAVKSNWELFRGWLVFKMFTYNSLVDNSFKLYKLSKRLLGSWMTEKLLRASVFSQFTGGVDEAESEGVVRKLADHGISSIWFYSDEKDLEEVQPPQTMEEFNQQEQLYQSVNENYLRSIEMSASCNCDTATRFAAIKLTAIVTPSLLKKLSEILLASDKTFFSLVTPNATLEEEHTYRNTMPAYLRKVRVPLLVKSAGFEDTTMDIVDWRNFFSLPQNVQRFQLLTQLYNKSNEELPECCLTDMEQEQLKSFVGRLSAIGECASALGVKVLIDAEQSYFQHSIEHLVLYHMMKKFNHTHPVIYNTAQAYLTRVHKSLLLHLTATQRMELQCGIKLVRGCYLEHETHLSKVHDYVSPIYPSKQATDSSYHQALDYLLSKVREGHLHLVVASHNKESIQRAVSKIKELNLSPSDGRVTFGQQLGMGDHLTYPLAQAGYIVNKVLAYGSLDNIVPFLTRRAQENRGFIRNAQEERLFYVDEMKRRLLG